MEAVSLAIRQSIVHYAKLAAALGLVPNTQGNVSGRDPATGLIAITPHDAPYATMTPDDLVIVDEAGRKVAGHHDTSYETPVHCVVYRERPDVQGIVHTEPIYVNSFGVLGKPIEPIITSLLVNLGGAVPVMPFMPSGSAAFGHKMLSVMNPGHAVIWANHGLLTTGRSVEEAFRRTVLVENAAQIYHLALLHGQPHILTLAQLQGAAG